MPELTYDRVEVGEPIGPREEEITPERAESHHDRTEVAHPRFVGPDADVVEPSILSYMAMATLGEKYTGGGQIHTQLSFEFASPIRVGDTVVGEGEITDKFEKRGYNYVEYGVDFSADDGRRLGHVTIETVVGMDET